MIYDPEMIVTNDTRDAVIEQLATTGHHRASLVVMRNIDLANLYHGLGMEAAPTDTQRMLAGVVWTMAQHGFNGAVDPSIIRQIVREELEKLAPRQVEIIIPQRPSVVLDGVMHYATEEVIRTVAINHPVMMVGPAGCGKTTIGEHTAAALSLPFYITNVINDEHQLTGFVDGHGKYHTTPFRQAFENGGVWIADEIDAWDAGALLAANSALANGYASFPDSNERVQRHNDFRMVATANTFGTGADRVYVGRNELDAASLDRFAVITVDYDLELEKLFAGDQSRWLDRVWQVRRSVLEKRIRHVVSSRAIAMGATGLRAGKTWENCEDHYLFKGMSEKDREKIDG